MLGSVLIKMQKIMKVVEFLTAFHFDWLDKAKAISTLSKRCQKEHILTSVTWFLIGSDASLY